MKNGLFSKSLAILSIAFAASCSTGDLAMKTASHVDLSRYMGDWYVIANIPNFIEKNCSDSIETYVMREDGQIDNRFTCLKPDGSKLDLTSLLWVDNHETNAEWKVRFNLKTFLGNIPVPIHFSYLILDLDTVNYDYTVVGHPNRKLLWIMSKHPNLDEKLYQQIVGRLVTQGYDISKIVKVSQKGNQRADISSGVALSIL